MILESADGKKIVFDGDITTHERLKQLANHNYAHSNLIIRKFGSAENNKRFELTEVTELEARIITAFNDFLYESLAPNFTIEPNRRYSEILHLTYFVKSAISDSAAKFIISVPKDILGVIRDRNSLAFSTHSSHFDEVCFNTAEAKAS